MLKFLASDSGGWSDMVYDMPVFREINLFFDWFGTLIWYWKIGVAFAIIVGIWMFLKLLGLIFGTADE